MAQAGGSVVQGVRFAPGSGAQMLIPDGIGQRDHHIGIAFCSSVAEVPLRLSPEVLSRVEVPLVAEGGR